MKYQQAKQQTREGNIKGAKPMAKNIVVIGGATPNKFGNEFVCQAREAGHRVKVLTWRQLPQPMADTAWADFNDIKALTSAFRNLVSDLDHIDILLYNANGDSYPDDARLFTTNCGGIDPASYHRALAVQVMAPHALSLAALPRMDSTSALIFMTSNLGLDHERTDHTQLCGYAGGKSWQTYLMTAFAYHNDRGVISTAISPFLDYNDDARRLANVARIVDFAVNIDRSSNGRIVEFY